MHCLDRVDLLPSLARSLTPPNVLGCSSFSSPPLLRFPHKRRGRGKNQAARAFQRRRVNVLTRAAMGRFSGAIHGNNARRGFRKTGSGRDEEDDQHDGTEPNSGQDNSSTEGSKHHGFCDDVSDDEASVYSQKRRDSRELGMDIDVYDDVHGDFWPNDPYFQEMEASAGQEQLLDKNGTTHVGDSAQITTMDHGRPRHGQKFQTESDGIDKIGAIIDPQAMTCCSPDASSTRVTQSEQLGSVQMQEDRDLSEKTYPIAMDYNIRVAESSSLGILDVSEKKQPAKSKSQKHLPVQIDRGRKSLKVRETEDAERPVDTMGFLEAVGEVEIEGGQHFRNTQIDPTDLEDLQDNKQPSGTVGEHNSADFGVLNPSHLSGCKRDEQTFVSDETGLVSIDHSDIAENYISSAEKIPFQDQSLLEGVVDHQRANSQERGNQSTEDIVQVEDIPTPIVEQVGQVVEQVSQVADQVSQAAEQIAEQVASHIVDPITTTASQIGNILSADEDSDDSDDSDDEFEAYRSLDVPEFKGVQGLNNFTILQEDQGLLVIIYDFYIYMLKRPLPEFVLGMFAAPIFLSAIFTLFYLPEIGGLALDETARQFFDTSGKNAEVGPVGLQLSSQTLFQVFMFSVSLSTGLQPELAPLSPYTVVVANLNALIAQLIFVFLSGAVFARLTQPSQPVRCSVVALVCPPSNTRRLRKEACHKVLLTRFVLVGPQPCELVDVKVDLTYKYNTVTRSGTYFRMQQPLKLVRSEIAYLNHGMLVRHIIDEASPLYQRTQGMLEKEDGIFSLSVVGLERSSMQSIFHVQHYCVYDGDVIWNAEFEDMILLSKKNRRVVDHSLLSAWRRINSG